MDDSDSIEEQYRKSLFPKLPFLLEEREESSLKAFFDSPQSEVFPDKVDADNERNNATTGNPPPISPMERGQLLTKILKMLEDDSELRWWQSLPSTSRIQIIMFLSESADGSQLWSSKDCSDLVAKICDEITMKMEESSTIGTNHTTGNGSLSNWFRKNYEECLTPNETDFHRILEQTVKSKYNRSDWKYFPVSVHGFGWIIQQIQNPQLANDIDMVVPPALLFSDDHYDDLKVVGLKMLAHIVLNSEHNDLIRNNWSNVIYDAVNKHITEKDSCVIELIMKILMRVMSVTEKNPSTNSSQFTRYDQLFKQVLFQMEFCSDLRLKQTWLPILNSFMDTLGLATLHWSDKICDVLRDYTTCADSNIWKQVLKVTATLIKNTWLKTDCEGIGEILLRVIFNVSCYNAVSLSAEEKKEILEQATNCFKLLQKCDNFSTLQNQLKEITEHGNAEHVHPNFIECLDQVIMTFS